MARQIITIDAPDQAEFFDKVKKIGADAAAEAIGKRIVESLLSGEPSWAHEVGLKGLYDIDMSMEKK